MVRNTQVVQKSSRQHVLLRSLERQRKFQNLGACRQHNTFGYQKLEEELKKRARNKRTKRS